MAHDLTIHATWTCCSNVNWSTQVPSSDGSKTYTVSYGPSRGVYQYDWSCNCPNRRRGYCKHIEQVRASGDRCGWNGTLEVGVEADRRDDGTPCCPDCGGEVTAFNVGV